MTTNNDPKKNIPTNINSYITYLAQQPNGFVYSETQEKDQAREKIRILQTLKKKYQNCHSCPLASQGRQQVVFGVGNPNAKLMFIGEAPGRDEDTQGIPFIGRAGKLLTKIIDAMKLTRQDVYISNVVKCRPPNNRTPTIEERETCKQLILFKEVEIIKPKIICTLGAPATQGILGDEVRISTVRGRFFEFKTNHTTSLVMPTYHPAYLLRNPSQKRTVWEDMKKIMAKLKEL